MNVTIYMWAGLGVAVLAQAVLARLVMQQQRTVDRLEERVGHLLAGISLLTDTTEGGLRDIALEISRVSAPAAKPAARAATTRRINGAARRGRTVRDIAAAEQLSEGEVRLRLKLADSSKQVEYASMR
jgi:hypothetical protein